jgi:hypothetical protein
MLINVHNLSTLKSEASNKVKTSSALQSKILCISKVFAAHVQIGLLASLLLLR